MKTVLILVALTYGQLSLAHYSCEGICKYTYYDSLRSTVVSGSGDSQGSAYSKMRDSCASQCDGTSYKNCSIVNYSCGTPDHAGLSEEIMNLYVEEVKANNL
jgi:hypothetical protein